MTINRNNVRTDLKAFDFGRLFIEELGWDRPPQTTVTARLDVDYLLKPVAHKRGLVVFVCQTDTIPVHAVRQKVEREATKAAHEHLLVFTDQAETTQVWQ